MDIRRQLNVHTTFFVSNPNEIMRKMILDDTNFGPTHH